MSTAIYTTDSDSSIDSLLTAAARGAYGVRNQYDSRETVGRYSPRYGRVSQGDQTVTYRYLRAAVWQPMLSPMDGETLMQCVLRAALAACVSVEIL